MSMSSWHMSAATATATSPSSFLSLFDDDMNDLFAASPVSHAPLNSSPLSPSAPLVSDDPFDLLSAVAGPLPLSSPSPKRPHSKVDSDKKAAAIPSLSSSHSPSLGAIFASSGLSSSHTPSSSHSFHVSAAALPSSKRGASIPSSSHSTSHTFSHTSSTGSSLGFTSASTSPALGSSRQSSVSSSNTVSHLPPYIRTDSSDMLFTPCAPGGPAASSQPSSAAPSPVSTMDFGSLAGLSSPFWQSTAAEDSPPPPRKNSSPLLDDQLLPSLAGTPPTLSSISIRAVDGSVDSSPTESEAVSFFSPIFWNAAAPSPPSASSSTSSFSATPSQLSHKHHRTASQPSDLSHLSLSALSSLAGSPMTSPSASPYARTRSNSNSNSLNPFLFTPTTTSLPHPTNESPFAATAPATLPIVAPYSSPSSGSSTSSSSSSSSDSATSHISSTSPAPSSTSTPAVQINGTLAASSDADKLSRLRARIANEILTSETNYVESLSTLLGCFLQPLQTSCNSTDSKPIITEEQLSILSSNINQIAQLNARFLSDIQDRIESWTEETCLGPLFLEFAHFFKIYTWYVSNHDQTVVCLQQLEGNNARWRDFCAEVMKRPRVRNLPLSSFLIMPIQRIPRYKLLLSELLKHTPAEHPDHDALEKALGLVSNVAAHINDSVRANENRMKVREIQSQFIGANFVSPSRRYIRSGMMQKQCRSSVKTYLFILFNDVLVYASRVVVTNKYKVHKEIEIDGVFRVVDMKDEEDSVKGAGAGSGGEDGSKGGSEERKDTITPAAPTTSSSSDTPHRLYKFKIYNSAKSFIVMTADPAIKQHWLTDLHAVITERKKTIKLPASSSFPASSTPVTHAPMFAGDHSSSTCQRCDKRFSLTVRKHHCRSCGKLCCAECLGAKMKVRGEESAVRVCWKCAGREEVRVKKEVEKKKSDEREKHEKDRAEKERTDKDKENQKEKEREAIKEAAAEKEQQQQQQQQQPVEQDILGILPAQ